MERITLGHGSGGKLMHDLIKGLFLNELKNPFLADMDDAAAFNIDKKKVLLTTDSYVVSPLFFSGGDIGKICIYGTVNDLSVCGARPLYISVGMIMEEGLEMEVLKRVTRSIKIAARRAGVNVVTGDMKVVEKGSCDKLFINTSGVGIAYTGLRFSLNKVRPGDRIIVSGPIGQHGVSIIASREGFKMKSDVKSDCAPLNGLISKIVGYRADIKFMRDPTRGGLAATLNEFAEDKDFGILINEDEIPLSAGVKSACELLGLDPLYMANEGRVVIIASKQGAGRVLRSLRLHRYGRGARIIGRVVKRYKGKVCLETRTGGLRLIKMPTGEQLPRIC